MSVSISFDSIRLDSTHLEGLGIDSKIQRCRSRCEFASAAWQRTLQIVYRAMALYDAILWEPCLLELPI